MCIQKINYFSCISAKKMVLSRTFISMPPLQRPNRCYRNHHFKSCYKDRTLEGRRRLQQEYFLFTTAAIDSSYSVTILILLFVKKVVHRSIDIRAKSFHRMFKRCVQNTSQRSFLSCSRLEDGLHEVLLNKLCTYFSVLEIS